MWSSGCESLAAKSGHWYVGTVGADLLLHQLSIIDSSHSGMYALFGRGQIYAGYIFPGEQSIESEVDAPCETYILRSIRIHFFCAVAAA